MQPGKLPLRSLNHLSLLVNDVEATARFYEDVLGFVQVKRPHALEESFHGAWLHNYNIGIHLIKGTPIPRPTHIDPKADHVSYTSDNIADVEARLQQCSLPYAKQQFVEDGFLVTQVFFHDPEHHMIEVCTCDVLPVIPLGNEAHQMAICPTCVPQLEATPSEAPAAQSDGEECVSRRGEESESLPSRPSSVVMEEPSTSGRSSETHEGLMDPLDYKQLSCATSMQDSPPTAPSLLADALATSPAAAAAAGSPLAGEAFSMRRSCSLSSFALDMHRPSTLGMV